jgi:hypothetical protein
VHGSRPIISRATCRDGMSSVPSRKNTTKPVEQTLDLPMEFGLDWRCEALVRDGPGKAAAICRFVGIRQLY